MITNDDRRKWEAEDYFLSRLKFENDLSFAKEHAQMKRCLILRTCNVYCFPAEIWNLVVLFGTEDPNIFDLFKSDDVCVTFEDEELNCWQFYFGDRRQLNVFDPGDLLQKIPYYAYLNSWYDIFSSDCEVLPFAILDKLQNYKKYDKFTPRNMEAQEKTRNILIQFRDCVYKRISK
jgi:hypothetical protein